MDLTFHVPIQYCSLQLWGVCKPAGVGITQQPPLRNGGSKLRKVNWEKEEEKMWKEMRKEGGEIREFFKNPALALG